MLKAGIVGLPNVGKSTLFNAVTRTRKAVAANYPFCTIDPNVGIVTVPDARLAVPPERRVALPQCAVPSSAPLDTRGATQQIPSVPFEIEKHRNLPIRFPARGGHEGHTGRDQPVMLALELVDAKEEADTSGELVPDDRGLLVAIRAR